MKKGGNLYLLPCNDNFSFLGLAHHLTTFRGGYNQRVMTQFERDESRRVLNLHQPFILSRRRNASSGENAREEVCLP